MSHLQDDDTVVIQPGTYQLNHGFYVTRSGITICGATGNRDDVILGGGGMNNSSDVSRYEGISLVGTDNTVKDLTVEEFYHHAIHFQPGADRAHVQNVTTRNIGEQHMKGAKYSTGGIIENCLLEQTYVRTNDGVARPDNYLGGIDLLGADHWTVRDNVVRDIEGIHGGGAGILLWQDITNCTIERNLVIGCAAGLHLGNTSSTSGAENCIVRNNFLVATSNDDDALMALVFTEDVKVYNNTIYGGVPGGTYWFTMLHVYDNGLVPTVNLDLQNNLIRGRVWDRATGDWSSSAVRAMGNLVDVSGDLVLPSWFDDAIGGDLHLTDEATDAIGQGTVLTDALYDFDRDFRGGIGYLTDLGADLHVIPEFTPGDTDLDGDVDFSDFNTLANHYTGAGGSGKSWLNGDFDADADVDFADFDTLANHYTGALAAANVPEPSALLLLGAGTLGLLAYAWPKRRRYGSQAGSAG